MPGLTFREVGDESLFTAEPGWGDEAPVTQRNEAIKWEACRFNEAPTKAFNRLIGRPFFRSSFDGILAKSRASHQTVAQAFTDYLVDGGLSCKALQGCRFPYLDMDGRVHALAMIEKGTINHRQFDTMCVNNLYFSLMLLAILDCHNALIRVD